MSGVEAAVAVGAAVVTSAMKVWLGDRELAADPMASAVDWIAGRSTDYLQRRRLGRMFDQMVDIVAAKLARLVEVEFSGLPDNERLATLTAVRDTFELASLTDEDLFAHDLNAGYVDRALRGAVPEMPRRAGLSMAADPLYDLLLRECSEYLVQVTMTLPRFQTGALTEILRRETEMVATLEKILARLPERREGGGRNDFEVDYRRHVTNSLDWMELFGATLSEASRRYPLSVAYISLSISEEDTPEEQGGRTAPRQPADKAPPPAVGSRVEHVLKTTNRIFVRGDAGSGKTTLLRWIAVRSALGDFPADLAGWNDTLPFFIPLRRYVGHDLPAAEEFLENVGRHIAEEMPKGWVQAQLRAGRAIVLVDGVDELPNERQRENARAWLRDLMSSFPRARYVVTSRSGAARAGWLYNEGFTAFELLSMTPADTRAFVHQWHEAIRNQTADVEERRRLDEYERALNEKIAGRRHLRALAEAPLLCALLCALHRDRRAQLPQNRMELYDVALEMLLERRDTDRSVVADTVLSRTDKTILLQKLAYWLIRNDWSEVLRSRAIDQIAEKLPLMTRVTAGPAQVYQHLLERSGLIREPVADRVDFVHRTFQEYLAALEALAADDIGKLVNDAHLDQRREVVIMAAGHAYARKRDELLRGLIRRGDDDPLYRDQLHLLALACLETSPELSMELRAEIRKRASRLLPPKNLTTAKSLASAGDFVLELLAQATPRSARETAATVRAAAEIGGDAALRIIAKYGSDSRETVQKELIQAWSRFDPDEYALTVLRQSPLSDGELRITDPDLFPSLRHLANLRGLSVSSGRAGRPNVELTALANLADLESVDLEDTQVTDLTPLANLTKLRYLSVHNAQDANLTPLVDLANLVWLDLAETQVTDITALANLTDLEYLYLTNTQVTDLSPLANLTKLTHLHLDNTQITDISPLANLTKLTYLHLDNTQITDISPLANLTKLEYLDVSDTQVTDLSPVAKLGRVEIEVTHLSDTLHG
jgi:hypothetical protein